MSKLIVTIEDAIRIIRQQCDLPDWIDVQIGDQQPTGINEWHDVSCYNEVETPAIAQQYGVVDIMFVDGDIHRNVTADAIRWNKIGSMGDIIKFRKASQ